MRIRIFPNSFRKFDFIPNFLKNLIFSFLVERLDAPIERIEIRLINENSTAPLVIDISKGLKDTAPHTTTSAPAVLPPDSINHHHIDTRTEVIGAGDADHHSDPSGVDTTTPKPEQTHEQRFVHIVIEPETTTTSTTASSLIEEGGHPTGKN